MRRALHIGDLVCVREEAVESSYPDAKAHVPCEVVDRYSNGTRTVLAIDAPWMQARAMRVWPSEVWLADGAGERLWLSKNKLRAAIKAENLAKRKARQPRKSKRTKTKTRRPK